jgi:hypothetical protein
MEGRDDVGTSVTRWVCPNRVVAGFGRYRWWADWRSCSPPGTNPPLEKFLFSVCFPTSNEFEGDGDREQSEHATEDEEREIVGLCKSCVDHVFESPDRKGYSVCARSSSTIWRSGEFCCGEFWGVDSAGARSRYEFCIVSYELLLMSYDRQPRGSPRPLPYPRSCGVTHIVSVTPSASATHTNTYFC